MSTIEQNKASIQRLYEEALNTHKLELLTGFVAPEYSGPGGLKGAAGFGDPLKPLIVAFPDFHWQLDELLAEGDKVMIRWTVTGTHLGPLNGLAGTGKKISSTGIGVMKMKEGKVISGQVLTDRLGFLQELGLLPLDVNQFYTRQGSAGQVRFIDKFLVPAAGKQAFLERVKINRAFIKKLPGFVEDAAYERTDEQGNLVFITVAVWAHEQALQKAKEAVQGEYKREGFNPAAFMEGLGITMDRGVYTTAGH